MYTGVFIGYNLTNAVFMTNQYDHFVHDSAFKKLSNMYENFMSFQIKL